MRSHLKTYEEKVKDSLRDRLSTQPKQQGEGGSRTRGIAFSILFLFFSFLSAPATKRGGRGARAQFSCAGPWLDSHFQASKRYSVACAARSASSEKALSEKQASAMVT